MPLGRRNEEIVRNRVAQDIGLMLCEMGAQSKSAQPFIESYANAIEEAGVIPLKIVPTNHFLD